MNSHVLILAAGLIIIVSYFCNIIAQKTNIPSVLLLMIGGFVLKQFVDIDENQILPYLQILGTVGVILIVLEAALDLHLTKDKLPIIWRASVMALVMLLMTSFILAGGIYLIVGAVSEVPLTFLQALIYAVPLSVMSSAIIIPSVHGLKESKKEFLIYESALSDILGIILFYALLDIGRAGEGANMPMEISSNILMTIGLSLVISYVLIVLFQFVKGHVKLFLLIGILLAFYAAGKLLHMSSLIMILIFGLILNNKKLFFPGSMTYLIRDEQFDDILKNFRTITMESAFVVRTFFFVAFGMSIVVSQLADWTVPIITLIALVAIYLPRWGGLKLFFGNDIQPDLFVAPRGLITVLLFYAIPAEQQVEAFAPGILLLTILITSVLMTFGLIRAARTQPAVTPNESVPQVETTQETH